MTGPATHERPATGPQRVLAPQPPGRLAEPASTAELADYLDRLTHWRDARRSELEHLDRAALAAREPDVFTADITLSMALWQAADERTTALVELFDSGRADRAARQRLSHLIWGRLDRAPSSAAAGAVPVAFVEACRLSDALAVSLAGRLAFDPQAADVAARVAALRACLERCRGLLTGAPEVAGRVQRLIARVEAAAASAARGGDITGLLPQLEADAARCERDLIVQTATARQAERDQVAQQAQLAQDQRRAAELPARLALLERAAREEVQRCTAEFRDPPRLAVPSVAALGRPPQERTALTAWLERAGRVETALDVVRQVYAQPFTERSELLGLYQAWLAMAQARGVLERPDVARACAVAQAALRARPFSLRATRELVGDVQHRVQDEDAAPLERER